MKKRSVEEWQALFVEQLASGLSARQFCVQRNMCPQYFSLRRRQLSESESEPAPSGFVQLRREVPVAIAQTPATVLLRHGRIELELHAVSP